MKYYVIQLSSLFHPFYESGNSTNISMTPFLYFLILDENNNLKLLQIFFKKIFYKYSWILFLNEQRIFLKLFKRYFYHTEDDFVIVLSVECFKNSGRCA